MTTAISEPTSPPPKNFTNTLGMPFVLAPRATFWMGGRGWQEQVEIPHDFYLGIYPVTQGQWQALMGNNPSWFSRDGGGQDKVRGISDAELKDFPIECVSRGDGGEFDVEQFIAKLNAKEPNREWLYRLPTGAEWEYICRGGATSQHECNFDFYFDQRTNRASSHQANFNGSHPAGNAKKGPYLERTEKVGHYKANKLGVFDMHGNVWEWCLNACSEGTSVRVIRGGGWFSGAQLCWAALSWDAPLRRGNDLGFRLARVPSGQ